MSATIFGPRLMLIGGGAIGRVPEALSKLGICNPLIVTDPFMMSSGMIDALTGPLTQSGVSHGVFSDTVPDPTTTVVDAGVEAELHEDHDPRVARGVVALAHLLQL